MFISLTVILLLAKSNCFACRRLYNMAIVCVRSSSVCVLNVSIITQTHRVIEANSLLLSFQKECVDLQRAKWKDEWMREKIALIFSRPCSLICAVLWEIESARFSSPPKSPASFNTARAAGSQWKRNQRGIYFDGPKICIHEGNLLRTCGRILRVCCLGGFSHLCSVLVRGGSTRLHIYILTDLPFFKVIRFD